MPKFTTPGPISVRIDLGVVGDVHIKAGDRTDTIVEVRPRDASRGADIKAADLVRVDYADERLRIEASRQWRQFVFMSNGGAVDITIELPTGSQLDGDLAMGRIEAEGLLGACRLKTAMGNARIDQVGSLDLSTSYGDVTVKHVDGDAEVSTSSGKVRIGTIDGTATIKNSNGNTTLGSVTGPLRVKAANGNISVDHVGASVNATTANGNIRIGDAVRGSVDIETAAGELEVRIHEGTAAWLDVSSRFGSVRNSLQAADGPEEPDATVEVRGRTSYGDIIIGRASA